MHVRRGQAVKFSIIHIDVEIGQKRPFWTDPLDPFEGAIEMGMGRMWPESHGIDDQHLNALEASYR